MSNLNANLSIVKERSIQYNQNNSFQQSDYENSKHYNTTKKDERSKNMFNNIIDLSQEKSGLDILPAPHKNQVAKQDYLNFLSENYMSNNMVNTNAEHVKESESTVMQNGFNQPRKPSVNQPQ